MVFHIHMCQTIVCSQSNNDLAYEITTKRESKIKLLAGLSSALSLYHHLQVPRGWRVVRDRENALSEMSFHQKVKYESIKRLHLICPFKLAPLIIINSLHYISQLNYMCYKGIIALKDAYCDPSSFPSGADFSLVINKVCSSRRCWQA